MRIIRFVADSGETCIGCDSDGESAEVLTGSMARGFERSSLRRRIRKLLMPVQPPNVVCVGRNYSGGGPLSSLVATATSSDRASAPDQTLEVFLKPTTALQHPDEPILLPAFPKVDPQLDCEGELAVMIGREARNVSAAHAIEFILGYSIANDVTARAFQTASGPPLWMRGKGFDTFCPVGPAIVTVDEAGDVSDRAIRTVINGKVAREGRTSQMIFSVPEIVSCLSRHMTLVAGTLILTGAPPANNQSAGRSLKAGDRVEIEIEGLGTLRNAVR